ncbi:MAG: hypothetical protein WCX65_02670 [bacterium]
MFISVPTSANPEALLDSVITKITNKDESKTQLTPDELIDLIDKTLDQQNKVKKEKTNKNAAKSDPQSNKSADKQTKNAKNKKRGKKSEDFSERVDSLVDDLERAIPVEGNKTPEEPPVIETSTPEKKPELSKVDQLLSELDGNVVIENEPLPAKPSAFETPKAPAPTQPAPLPAATPPPKATPPIAAPAPQPTPAPAPPKPVAAKQTTPPVEMPPLPKTVTEPAKPAPAAQKTVSPPAVTKPTTPKPAPDKIVTPEKPKAQPQPAKTQTTPPSPTKVTVAAPSSAPTPPASIQTSAQTPQFDEINSLLDQLDSATDVGVKPKSATQEAQPAANTPPAPITVPQNAVPAPSSSTVSLPKPTSPAPAPAKPVIKAAVKEPEKAIESKQIEKAVNKEPPAPAATKTAPVAPPKTAASAVAKPDSSLIVMPATTDAKTDEKKPFVEVKGYRYLKFREYKSTGSSGQFISREGLVNRGGKIEQGTDLSVNAKVGDKTKLTGSFNEMPHQERAMMFKLEQGFYGLTYGDFSASVTGGSFAAFSKNITGLQFDYKTGRTNVSTVMSKSKSQSKTISFSGRNIKGPYDLNARDLVPDQITVQLNSAVIPSSDYIIDAFAGEITFNQILGPNDIVMVNYEQRLTGNLSEGNILAFAADQTSKNDKLSYGVSHLVQQANRQTQKLTEAIENETATINMPCNSACPLGSNCIQASKQFIVRFDYLNGTETIFKSGSSNAMEPNKDYNRLADAGTTSGEQVACIMGNYRDGKFLLPAAATSTYTINYSYYPTDTVVQYVDKEYLYLDSSGAFGYPAKPTIYNGSETITKCDDAELTSCQIVPMKPGQDYTIDEQLNRINFFSPIGINTYIRIDYWRYPDVTALESKYDHTVDDFRLKYDPSKSLAFEYERASSLADIASQNISVLNETVAIVAAPLDCSIITTKACSFNLANVGISQGSFVLYFNDRVSTEGIVSAANYSVDYSRGEVTLKTPIPANTLIIADYQYRPPSASQLAKGNRDRFSAKYKGDKTQVNFSLDTGDTFFSPLGGGNNLEIRRLSYGITQKISENLNVSADFNNVDNAADILKTHIRSNNSQSYNLNFKSKAITRFGLNYDKRQNTDDYNPSQSESTDDKLAVTLGMPVPFLKNADIITGYSNTDHKDMTAAASRTKTNARSLGFNYKPSTKLMLTTQYTINSVDTSSVRLNFNSKNASNKIGLNWTPIPMLMIAADVDSQSTTDSRPSVEPRSINRSRIALSTRPFGFVKTVQLNFTQQDSPSVNGPSSGTKTSQFQTGFIITKSLSFSPAFSIADTYVGDDSSTNNKNKKYDFEYRPPGRPYHAVLSLQNNDVSTTNRTQSLKSTSSGWNLALGYDPNQVWSYSTTFQSDSFSSAPTPGYKTGTLQSRVTRKTESSNQWFQLQNVSRSGSSSDKNLTMELGTDNKLTKIISLNLLYRLSNFKNSLDSKTNYTGHLFEGTFKATF